jgi:Asp-tRNA(Asn)/Glu-tRNA(Gln) amidotransferase C subunit
LQGKNICEISLGDSESIIEGIGNYNENDESNLNGSMYDILTKGDQVRKDTFREIGFAPKILII